MRVIDRENDSKHYEVYDITYDSKTGYPRFLIYRDNQWLRVSAKYFKPYNPLKEFDDAMNVYFQKYPKKE